MVCLVGITLLTTLHVLLSLTHILSTFTPDFSVYYTASKNIYNHHNPYTDTHVYTGFGYPLMTAFFFMPFLLFPQNIAQNIFTLLSFISFLSSVTICLFIMEERNGKIWLLAYIVSFLSFPTKFTLGMGQVNFIAYVLLLLGFLYYLRKQPNLTIFFFTVAILLKPIFISILLFLLFQKSWRTLSLVIFFLFLITLCTFFLYPNYLRYYLFSIIPTLLKPSGREIYYNQGTMGFIARLTPDSFLRELLSIGIEITLFVALIMKKVYGRVGKRHLFALILTAMVLTDSLSWQHHFVFLLFPFIFLFTQVKKSHIQWRVFLFVTSLFFVGTNIKDPAAHSHFPSNIILSHVFYGGFILFLLLLTQTNSSHSTFKEEKNQPYHDRDNKKT